MKEKPLGPWEQKWRLVHINAGSKYSWVTIQFPDLTPLGYEKVRGHQEELKGLIAGIDMQMGSIGDSYSEWIPDAYMPEWAVTSRDWQLRHKTNGVPT